MTAEGAAFVILTKEPYKGEHNKIIKSVSKVNGLSKIVENCANFMKDIYEKNNKFYPYATGVWVLKNYEEDEFTKDDVGGELSLDIAKLLD
jgi:hypothetical protein